MILILKVIALLLGVLNAFFGIRDKNIQAFLGWITACALMLKDIIFNQ